jgi:hypothetical protein
MATRTFLELVNDVLTELREPTVATWGESDYSTLIARFVNAAKRDVENAWDWTALRTSFSVTTGAGDVQYTLTGARERFKLLQPTDAFNFTKKWPLTELNRSAHREFFYGDFSSTTGLPTGPVEAFSFHESLDSNSRQVNVWPVPTGADVLRFFGYNPPDDWTADIDICYIPHKPIVEVALARARGERGEDGGISAGEQAAFALRASQDEIARDANRYDEDLTWEAV